MKTGSFNTLGTVGNCMRTASGIYLDLLDPRPEQINIQDIAHALGVIPRFGGHTPYPYSVAEHSVLCASRAQQEGLSRQVQLACLLHDASEAYLGDVIRPLKNLLAQAYLPLEAMFQELIGEVLAVDFQATAPDWKRIDLLLLLAEKRKLFPEDSVLWNGEANVPIIHAQIRCLSSISARQAFLDAYKKLTTTEVPHA